MICKQCGAALPEDAAFCINCGATAPTPIDTSNQETMPLNPVEPMYQEQGSYYQQPQQSQQFYEQPAYQQPQQSYEQSAYQQPTYEQPAYQQPVYQQPAYPQNNDSGKGKGVVIGVVIAIVALLIVGVIVAVIALGGGISLDNGGSSDKGGDSDSHIVEQTKPKQDEDRVYELDESNMYYDEYVDADSYVLSSVSTRYYSRAELAGMTRQQLFLAEREMFARYGCTFNDGDLDEYFSAKKWYTPDAPVGNFNESRMTDIEQVNLLLLRAMLMEKDGTASNNPYLKVNSDVEGWILSTTDAARITKDDVKDLGEKELTIASYEIYARKGVIFEDRDLQLYFSSKNWYVPATPYAQFDAATLSEIESENYTCLQACAKKKTGVRFSSGNKYEDYYYSYSEYQCPGSDKNEIDPWTLRYMTAEQLQLARNEIYARYGYSFTNTSMNEYFMNCSWYYPTVVSSKLELIHLSKIELANVKMIQAFELDLKLGKGEGNPNTKMSYYAKHDFLTMYLPDHWRNNCICIKPNGTAGNMHFYEKYNQDYSNDGWVYSIEFVSTDASIPSYYGKNVEVYGYVTTPDGKEYYVLKVTPQYDEAVFLYNVYDLMESQVDTIWNSIEWKSGYTFSRA